ncbi:uncharacterized protein KD926_003345 [Aspergillus affinis]|uniref:uncharacterized protein n=1 Tax=Aspergillus affinis TaxID=1070780 RepID=UPI0022FEE36F|nr:uncharacterized protein KD926_003345 [Aspergillus affinis]KAI9043575.1 hypothetical protein KD926_003345 [Aspergillus affinis]
MRTFRAGVFQAIEVISDDEFIIRDTIYGRHRITEPVLIELLDCPALARLREVCQHGITSLLGYGPQVTRYEHSVGAFLLVRKVGGSLEEQIAALLHDVSHTALSHVADWALSQPGESYHETHKQEYIATTTLPQILTKHGIDHRVFEEGLYPLVERPAPHLCADRLDYTLRDTRVLQDLTREKARQVYETVTAYPDATSPNRILTLSDPQLALALARAYIATDEDVWCNLVHLDMYRRVGQVIGDLVRREILDPDLLYKYPDAQFWKYLAEAAEKDGSTVIADIEAEARTYIDQNPGLAPPRSETLGLPTGAKVRTLDPDVALEGQPPRPLSAIVPEWDVERREYLERREAQRY